MRFMPSLKTMFTSYDMVLCAAILLCEEWWSLCDSLGVHFFLKNKQTSHPSEHRAHCRTQKEVRCPPRL